MAQIESRLQKPKHFVKFKPCQKNYNLKTDWIPYMSKTKKPFYEAVIFDMDGVFVDTEPLHYRSFVDVFEPLGVDMTLEYFYTFVGEPAGKNISDINHDFKLNLDVEEWTERLEQRYLDIVAHELLRPLSGVVETMVLARESQMKIGLATSSSRNQFDLLLSRVKAHTTLPESLNPLFDAIVTGDDVQNKKPAPDPYLLTAKQMNIKPAECIVIEDSESGVRSAKAAGCFCIARQTDYNKHMDLSHADRTIFSIKEVAKANFFV